LRRLALALGLALVAGCATPLEHSRIRPDYEAVDKHRVKRLAILTQPLPEDNPDIGELWSLIARRYVHQNRDFIPKAHFTRPDQPPDPSFRDICVEGIEGILWLAPRVERTGQDVKAAVTARLLRCSDTQDVWSAEAAGTWPSEDARYRELTAQYTREISPDVGPYVGPTFRLLKATLDSLPNPQLSDADITEKIELGE
jgi:probable lipoprotein (TIGR04455 family)